jgi:hypothetical protein
MRNVSRANYSTPCWRNNYSDMTLDKFVGDYDGAPLELSDFAYGAAQITDNQDLKEIAQEYLQAKRNFEHALDIAGVMVG